MKTTILIIILAICLSLKSFSQSVFSKRKYTKGVFSEKVHDLKEVRSKRVSKTVLCRETTANPVGIILPEFSASDILFSQDSSMALNKDSVNIPLSAKENNSRYESDRHHTLSVSNTRSYAFSSHEKASMPRRMERNKFDAYQTQNLQTQNATIIYVSKKQKRQTGFFWKEFFDPKNLQHVRFNNYSLQGISLSVIDYYQKYISPKKGFVCAHKVLSANGDSCSEYGKKAIKSQGFFMGSIDILFRLNDCAEASQKLNANNGCLPDNCFDFFFIGWGH